MTNIKEAFRFTVICARCGHTLTIKTLRRLDRNNPDDAKIIEGFARQAGWLAQNGYYQCRRCYYASAANN